jgi:transcription initiation factor TFIIE subunit alpha
MKVTKISKKLISEVVAQLCGLQAVDIVFQIRGKKDVSELDIAQVMKIDIQEARATLYKLYEANLASFERRRDKHKGWHISHWTFLEDNVPILHKKSQMDKIDQLKKRIKREKQNEFYMCRSACHRVDFEKAIELQFKCPECGELMHPQDNSRTLEVLSGKLKELESMD